LQRCRQFDDRREGALAFLQIERGKPSGAAQSENAGNTELFEKIEIQLELSTQQLAVGVRLARAATLRSRAMALAFALARIRHEELVAMRTLALPGGAHTRTVPLRLLADNPSLPSP